MSAGLKHALAAGALGCGPGPACCDVVQRQGGWLAGSGDTAQNLRPLAGIKLGLPMRLLPGRTAQSVYVCMCMCELLMRVQCTRAHASTGSLADVTGA